MIKAILFDFDGVIKESVAVKTEAFMRLFESYGYEVMKMVAEYHELHGGISRYEKIRYYYNVLLNKEVSEEYIEAKAGEFSSLVLQNVIESSYVKGAINFLENYSRSYPCFIVTGTPQEEISYILDKCQIKLHFQDFFGTPRTKEEIISIIKRQYHWANSEMVMIGDALSDYMAAKQHHIHFIGRETSTCSFPNDTNIIKDLTMLPEKIIELNNSSSSLQVKLG